MPRDLFYKEMLINHPKGHASMPFSLDRRKEKNSILLCMGTSMDVGIGGHRGHVLPPIFKISGKVPLSYNLVALLEDSEDTKITSKIHVSSDFRGSKF